MALTSVWLSLYQTKLKHDLVSRFRPTYSKASPSRTVQSTAGRVTGPSAFVPLAGGQGHAGFPVHTLGNVDPYGSGQPLPPPPARQLSGSILRSYNTVALDAMQVEADSFPYNGSVKARNALFLDTELRSGSMLTGFLGGGELG